MAKIFGWGWAFVAMLLIASYLDPRNPITDYGVNVPTQIVEGDPIKVTVSFKKDWNRLDCQGQMHTSIQRILGNGVTEHVWESILPVRSEVPARKEPYIRIATLDVTLPPGSYELRRHVQYRCNLVTNYRSNVAFTQFEIVKKVLDK